MSQCLVQGHNTMTPVRLQPVALRSQVKLSTTEPLCSLFALTGYTVYHNQLIELKNLPGCNIGWLVGCN